MALSAVMAREDFDRIAKIEHGLALSGKLSSPPAPSSIGAAVGNLSATRSRTVWCA